jgi:hypothetical protein
MRMKTKYLLLLAALMIISLRGFTQVTITFANSGFVPGDVSTVYTADTTGIVPGTTGANHTWDFSNLVIGSTTSSTNYVDPSTTANASSFPTATVAGITGTTYEYFLINSTQFTTLGSVTSNGSMVYSNTEKAWTLPFAYTNSSTDNFASIFTSGVTFYRRGTVTTTADGWGTLKLPAGSHSTLRLKMVQDIVDSTALYGNFTYHIETYIWYDGINKTPLLEINISAEQMLGSLTYGKSVAVAQSAAGIENYSNEISSLNIFPNPTSDIMTLTIDSKDAATAEISIVDIQGKVVKQINYDLTNNCTNKLTLDVADLSNGIYFVRVTTKNGILYKKLIKN